MNKEDMAFQKFVEQICEWQDTSKIYVLNPARLKLLQDKCKKLQTLLDNEGYDCEVKLKPCALGTGDVVVTFDTYDFVMRNMEDFYNAINEFSNFEIYPIDDEMIRFSGIFTKLAVVMPIKEVDRNT